MKTVPTPMRASKSITVNNVAPTVELSGDNDVDEGSTYSLTIGAITDPGDDAVADYIINWGDGSSDTVVGRRPRERQWCC